MQDQNTKKRRISNFFVDSLNFLHISCVLKVFHACSHLFLWLTEMQGCGSRADLPGGYKDSGELQGVAYRLVTQAITGDHEQRKEDKTGRSRKRKTGSVYVCLYNVRNFLCNFVFGYILVHFHSWNCFEPLGEWQSLLCRCGAANPSKQINVTLNLHRNHHAWH